MTLRRFALLGVFASLAVACSSSDTPSTTEDTTPADDTAVVDTLIDDTGTPGDDADTATPTDTADSSLPPDSDPDSTPTETAPDTTEVSVDSSCTPSGKLEKRDCGKCGTQERICLDGLWGSWGVCSGETGECVPLTTGDETCGKCGKRSRTCATDCTWSYGPCGSEGLCSSGEKETSYSTLPDGAVLCRSRTCGTSCTWGSWSAFGPTCP